MAELSKHKYIEVTALPPWYEQRYIRLPDEWDTMKDEEREAYVKKECFDYWQSIREDNMDISRDERYWWENATADKMLHWEIGDKPLAEVVTQPEVWLTLSGAYVRRENVWEEDELEPCFLADKTHVGYLDEDDYFIFKEGVTLANNTELFDENGYHMHTYME